MSWVSWLRYNQTEITNINRTVAYLRNGLARDSRISAPGNCDCAAIDEGPYVNPATDDAPWYVAARPESKDFLGVILNEIEVSAPWTRSVTPRGQGGNSLGAQILRGRTIGFRGTLFAATGQAMDYGKRWLSEVLRSDCVGCGIGDLCFLPACPEGAEVAEYRTFKRAGLIDGPTEVVYPDLPCDLLTGVAFQMGTEIGYMYADEEACMEAQVITAGAQECCLLSTEQWIGDATAKIRVQAGGPDRVEGLRITMTPTRDGVCPADPLVDAEAYWSAARYDGGADLDDLSGNGHHAAFGGGANSPLYLEPTPNDRQYLWLPGLSGNYASSPDHADLDIVGDIDIRWEIAPDDWTPGGGQVLVSKDNPDAFHMVVDPAALRFSWHDGAGLQNRSSTVGTGFTDGTRKWVRATLDVNNGAAGHDVKFYTSDDGVTWTQLGTTVTTAGVTSITSGAGSLKIGSYVGSSNEFAGKMYRGQIRNGIDGTIVFDADFSDAVAPFASFVETTGKTVTINRSATGRKSAIVDRPLFILGTDDFFTIPDHADLDILASDSFSLLIVGRLYGTTTGQFLIGKRNTGAAASEGYSIERGSTANTPFFEIADGAVESSDTVLTAITPGQVFEVGGVKREALDQVEAFSEGSYSGTPTTDATTTAPANSIALRIGSFGDGSADGDFEFFGAALWHMELTASQMSDAALALMPSGAPSAALSAAPCFDVEASLAPGAELVIDGSERIVEVRQQASGEVVGGYEALTFAGVFKWPDMGPCSFSCLCVDARNAQVNPNTKAWVERFDRET